MADLERGPRHAGLGEVGAGRFAVVIIELLNEQSIATSGHLAEGGEGEREQRVFENSNRISHGAAYLGIASFPGLRTFD